MTLKEKLMPLHLADETAWLERTARQVRRGRYNEVDSDALAQYLLDMAIRDRREVFSRLSTLIIHLLKWEYQAEKRTRSWEDTIARERMELQQLFASKTLKNHAGEVLEDVFDHAVKRACIQTKLARKVFPAACPYSLDDLLEE